ncbi:P-loop containing nucleoside triphosphate hydrolase protein, partial [Pelagophyceae sp. CCMP2097]
EEWGGVNGNAFKFDGLFWKSSEQSDIFDNVCREQVDHVLRGFNACCFAYGQTGSGKTHSMFFPRGGGDRGDAEKAGLIPRAVDYLFQRLGDSGAQAELHVSFLEVYCDTLRDLGKGAADSDAASLWYELKEEIREDADGNVFVKGLARLRVTTCAEVLDIIDRGLRLRATEATRMNDTSSRSHTVFTIEVVIPSQAGDKPTTGKLHLVDLAGSERLKKSESSGLRLFEALHINKSLMALGKVIVALDPSERSKNAHVPYRDSKLTRLLQNALGGDSFTSLLATIRPAKDHAEECLSTLQFANRCRRVANNPQVH